MDSRLKRSGMTGQKRSKYWALSFLMWRFGDRSLLGTCHFGARLFSRGVVQNDTPPLVRYGNDIRFGDLFLRQRG